MEAVAFQQQQARDTQKEKVATYVSFLSRWPSKAQALSSFCPCLLFHSKTKHWDEQGKKIQKSRFLGESCKVDYYHKKTMATQINKSYIQTRLGVAWIAPSQEILVA